jgi:hypothetical protein
MGTRYPSETRRVRVQISTRSLFTGGRVTALPDPNLIRCHPYGGEVEDDWRSRAIGGLFLGTRRITRWCKTKLTPKPVSLRVGCGCNLGAKLKLQLHPSGVKPTCD